MSTRSVPRLQAVLRTPVRRMAIVALSALVLGAATLAPSAGAQSGGDVSLVTVVHGLRGELVDVYLDGTLVLPAFRPDRITDPTPVAAGPHVVRLEPAAGAASSDHRLEQTVDIPANRSISLVAHYREDGSWGLATFTNDLSLLDAQGRIVARNTSGVGPVDVQVDGTDAPGPIAPGTEAAQLESAGDHSVSISRAGSTAELVPASAVPVSDGSASILYLVGRADDATWLVQRIDGLHTAPDRVTTGDSGLLPGSRPASHPTSWAGGLLLVAPLSLVIARARTSRRRPGDS